MSNEKLSPTIQISLNGEITGTTFCTLFDTEYIRYSQTLKKPVYRYICTHPKVVDFKYGCSYIIDNIIPEHCPLREGKLVKKLDEKDLVMELVSN